MKEVTYSCDRCGTKGKTIGNGVGQLELWNLRLVADPVTIDSNGNVKVIGAHLKGFVTVQWCAHCIVEVGASSATDEARAKILQVEEVALKTPTLESVLLEMLADHITDAVSDAIDNH